MKWTKYGLVMLAAALSPAALAQTRQIIQPDCVIDFIFTAAGQTAGGAGTCGNNVAGVYEWRITYKSTGFSALSLVVQSAPDNGGAPGAWATFVGTVVGVNPNTATTQNTTDLAGFNPWVRVLLTSKTGTGTITGELYGCRQPGCSIAGAAISAVIPTPVAVDGPTAAGAPPTTPPVLIAGQDSVPLIRTVRTDSNGQPIVNQGVAAPVTAPWPIYGGQPANATANWTPATPQDTVLAVSTVGYANVTFGFVKTGVITAGVVTFEGSTDGTNFVPVSVVAIGAGNSGSTSITLATQSNQIWQMFVGGLTSFRLRLSTAMTGGGSAAAFTLVATTIGAEFQQVVTQSSGLNLHTNVDTLPGATTAQADGQTNSPMQPTASPSFTAIKQPTYGYKFNGATWDRDYSCPNRTNIVLSAGTDVVIATGVAAQTIRLCQLSFNGATTADFTIRQGTGTTCLTNTADLAGMGQVTGLVSDFKSNEGPISTTVQARDMCLHVSTSVTILGWATYANF